MKLFKMIRFWLVWMLVAPFVLLYLAGATVFSGQWLLIGTKFNLIKMSLQQNFANGSN